MADPLPIHVNRDHLHDLGTPATFEATESFDIRLINHGEASHVHLHLDDALSEVARLEATNHYVEGEDERFVRVSVQEAGTVRGKLKVSIGYGAETRYVDVIITEPQDEQQSVQIDESLTKPKPMETDESRRIPLNDPVLPVLGLVAAGLLVAIGAALLVRQFVVGVGALAVFAGVIVAIFVLFAE